MTNTLTTPSILKSVEVLNFWRRFKSWYSIAAAFSPDTRTDDSASNQTISTLTLAWRSDERQKLEMGYKHSWLSKPKTINARRTSSIVTAAKLFYQDPKINWTANSACRPQFAQLPYLWARILSIQWWWPSRWWYKATSAPPLRSCLASIDRRATCNWCRRAQCPLHRPWLSIWLSRALVK